MWRNDCTNQYSIGFDLDYIYIYIYIRKIGLSVWHNKISHTDHVFKCSIGSAGSALKYTTVMCAKVELPPIRRRPAEPPPVHASPGPTLLDLPFALSRTFTLFAVALFEYVCVCVNALAIVVATVRCVILNYAKRKKKQNAKQKPALELLGKEAGQRVLKFTLPLKFPLS